ncbi:hypothetical protein [Streptomyces sp. 3N207]|uniref:hypothetical protein n=1 Tax=Streptomyces sp. 3N207 TaxID=3457417 RepID=UPI003FD03C0D
MSTAVGGSVGKNYRDLLDAWDQQAEIISKNLRDMVEQLNETLRQQGLTEGSSNDAINQQYQESGRIFDELAGPSTAG